MKKLLFLCSIFVIASSYSMDTIKIDTQSQTENQIFNVEANIKSIEAQKSAQRRYDRFIDNVKFGNLLFFKACDKGSLPHALYIGALYNQAISVERIINHCINLKIPIEGLYLDLAMLLAVLHDNEAIIALINNISNIPMDIHDAVCFAIQSRDVVLMRFLSKNGSNIDHANEKIGHTINASRFINREMKKLLFAMGIDAKAEHPRIMKLKKLLPLKKAE